jgi:hypothetical protein
VPSGRFGTTVGAGDRADYQREPLTGPPRLSGRRGYATAREMLSAWAFSARSYLETSVA